jgi:hypothetical protein
VTAIRPPGFPPTPAAGAPQRPDAARLAAQKAFFEAAMGKAPAAAPSAAPQAAQAVRTAAAAPATPAPAPQRTAAPNGEPPTRILRPGSLLDIRV